MNIVFDFGKVLFDWDPQALVARLLPEHAPDAAAARALVGDFFQEFQGDWGEFDRGRLDATTLADRIARRTGIAPAAARSVIDAVPHELQPMDGMAELLARLSDAGHALYFLSNMPLPYAEHLDAAHAFIQQRPEEAEIPPPPPEGDEQSGQATFAHENFVDGIYSGRVDLIKPEPAIFAHAVEQFGIDPAETLFVDDVAANVEAARTAGWQALRFESAVQCEAAMRGMGLFPACPDKPSVRAGPR